MERTGVKGNTFKVAVNVQEGAPVHGVVTLECTAMAEHPWPSGLAVLQFLIMPAPLSCHTFILLTNLLLPNDTEEVHLIFDFLDLIYILLGVKYFCDH